MPDECNLYSMFPDNTAPEPPIHVRSTYADEVYPVWIESDLLRAAVVFQQRHEAKGKLLTFVSENGGIDWQIRQKLIIITFDMNNPKWLFSLRRALKYLVFSENDLQKCRVRMNVAIALASF